jgi:hypothetical protein
MYRPLTTLRRLRRCAAPSSEIWLCSERFWLLFWLFWFLSTLRHGLMKGSAFRENPQETKVTIRSMTHHLPLNQLHQEPYSSTGAYHNQSPSIMLKYQSTGHGNFYIGPRTAWGNRTRRWWQFWGQRMRSRRACSRKVFSQYDYSWSVVAEKLLMETEHRIATVRILDPFQRVN